VRADDVGEPEELLRAAEQLRLLPHDSEHVERRGAAGAAAERDREQAALEEQPGLAPLLCQGSGGEDGR